MLLGPVIYQRISNYTKLPAFVSFLSTISFQSPPIIGMGSNTSSMNKAELKKFIESKAGFLIDVREPCEIQATSLIPSAINIPCGEVRMAFQSSPESFMSKFGFAKPPTDAQFVFYCARGARASQAAKNMMSLGYKNVAVYHGSYADWISAD